MDKSLEYPYGYDDVPKFHGLVICFEDRDFRDGKIKPYFGVLNCVGPPRVKLKLHGKAVLLEKPGNPLFEYKIVGSYLFWTGERRKKAQAKDKAAFRFRPATRAECHGARFAFTRDEDLRFAEDQEAHSDPKV